MTDGQSFAPTPISCLPEDILALIFIEACTSNEQFPLKSNPLEALKLSWICRHWRGVALDCATLWTSLPFPSLSKTAIPELLSRSKRTPLSVSVNDISSQAIQSTALLLIDQLDRIQNLQITRKFPEGKDLLRLDSFRDSDAPELQILLLSGVILPPGAFKAQSLPSLHHLALHFCEVAWSLPLFTNLTTLAILWPTSRLQVSNLFLFFERMPYLVALKLEAALDVDSTMVAETGSLRSIPLTHLETLQVFSEDANLFSQILSRIFIPRIAQIHLKLHYLTEEGQPAEILDQVFQQAKLIAKGQPIHHFKFVKGRWTCYIRASTSSVTGDPSDGFPFMELTLDYYSRIEPDIFSLCSNLLDFGSLQSVDLDGDCDLVTPHLWSTLFGHLPDLRIVIARGRTIVESLVQALDEEGERLRSAYRGILPPIVSSTEDTTQRREYLEACARVRSFLESQDILFPALQELSLLAGRSPSYNPYEGQWFSFYARIRRFGGIGLTNLRFCALPVSFPSPRMLQIAGVIDNAEWTAPQD